MEQSEMYSETISKLLYKLRQKAAKQADITILQEVRRKLESFTKELKEASWAWRLSNGLTGSAEGENIFSKVRESVEELLEHLRTEIFEMNRLDLQSLDEKISSISSIICELNETSVRKVIAWKEKMEQLCRGLLDFSDLLDDESTEKLLTVQEYLNSIAATAKNLAIFSGMTKESMNKKIKEWEKFKEDLERIQEKLKPENLEMKFGIKRQTIDILKRLVKGETIMIADLSIDDIKDLRNSEKLSKKIRISYTSEKKKEMDEQTGEYTKRGRYMRQLREAELI